MSEAHLGNAPIFCFLKGKTHSLREEYFSDNGFYV